MATLTESVTEDRRREDFPVESFRHLEAKLQRVRRMVMDLAAQIAQVKESTPQVYRVRKEYIDDALVAFLNNPGEAETQLGIKCTSPRESDSPPGN